MRELALAVVGALQALCDEEFAYFLADESSQIAKLTVTLLSPDQRLDIQTMTLLLDTVQQLCQIEVDFFGLDGSNEQSFVLALQQRGFAEVLEQMLCQQDNACNGPRAGSGLTDDMQEMAEAILQNFMLTET